MKRNVLPLCAALVVACLCARASTATRQSSSPTSKPTAQEKTKPHTRVPNAMDTFEQQLRVRVVETLRAVGDEARQWKDSAAAARAQSQVADLTWDVDGDAARVYLVRAWEAAGRVEEKGEATSAARYRNVSPRTEVRQEVLLVARSRERALAAKWLEQMAAELDAGQGSQPRGVFDDRTPRSTVLLQMALANAATNPQAAAELATESLRDGVSFGFQNVLIAIQEKDFSLAETVFRAALARLKNSGLADPNEIFILASYLYTPGRIVGANTTENRGSFPLAMSANAATIKAAAQLDPALALEFVRVAADALINSPLPTANAQEGARAQLSATGMLLSHMPPQMSEQAARLRQRAQQLEVDAQFSNAPRPSSPERPALQAGESLKDYEARRLDLMEEAARKETDPLARDIAFAKAALAAGEERYERGFSTAQSIKDDQLRQGVSDWLTYRATLAEIGAANFERASALIKRNSEPAERAASFVFGARKLLSAKDNARASEWLQEARATLKSADTDEDAARVAFGIAAVYAQFDNLLALQTLAEAVKITNQTRAAAAGVEDERAPLVKRFAGLTAQEFNHGTSGFGVKAAARAFGAEQFEDALNTLRQITSPEARGAAIVALSRQIMLRLQVSTPRRA
ncbi:MAG: hypothetical protein QOF61_2528 [Acidobacteriota bacterium]|jgi:hypothetical protein|nr:hypothetical protein [Acidobacteriota bacterium]